MRRQADNGLGPWKIFCLRWVWWVCLTAYWALPLGAEEPNPFRLEVMDGRDYSWSERSFLDRFSYRNPPEWQRRWDARPHGFMITAGSLSSDELYIDNQFSMEIPLEEWAFGILRYQRQEDFDGRYDRLLTGVGVNLPAQLYFGLFGSLLEHKEYINLNWELGWRGDDRRRARLVLVMPDYLYNSKISDDSYYNDRPYTYFFDGYIAAAGGASLYGWLNWTPRVRLNFPEESRQFDYDQLEGGARFWLPLSYEMGLQTSLEAQKGRRNSRALTPDFESPRDLDRRYVCASAELNRRVAPALMTFLGLRYFFLREDYFLPLRPEESGALMRREPMPYTGVVWDATGKITLRPTVYTVATNNRDYDPDDPESQRDPNRFAAKFNLPVEYRFSERAVASVAASVQSPPRGLFGGFNVQFLVDW